MHRPLALSLVALLALDACVSAAPAALAAAGELPTELPVPIYREVLTHGPAHRYYFSTRTAAEAERFGWRQLGIAFYAFVTPAPGTLAVYCETPASAPHSDYRFSTRPEAAALEDGWMRLHVAFYAYPVARPGTVPVALESPAGSIAGPFGLAVRTPAEARGFGLTQLETAFHAIATDAVGRRGARGGSS